MGIEHKKTAVAEISAALLTAETLVIADYSKTTAVTMTNMRANARAQQVILRVLKNTLVKKAISNGKFAALNPYMKGPLIYSISTDPVAAAKVIHQSASVKIIAGMYNGTILDATAVANLAVIRPREQLLSMLLSVMKQAPTAFIRAVAALRDKREQESSANIA